MSSRGLPKSAGCVYEVSFHRLLSSKVDNRALASCWMNVIRFLTRPVRRYLHFLLDDCDIPPPEITKLVGDLIILLVLP